MFTRTLPIGYLAKKTGTTVETIRAILAFLLNR